MPLTAREHTKCRRIYLNPIATHPLKPPDFSSIEDAFGDDVVVEEIADDAHPVHEPKGRRFGPTIVAAVLVLVVAGVIFRIFKKGTIF